MTVTLQYIGNRVFILVRKQTDTMLINQNRDGRKKLITDYYLLQEIGFSSQF